MNGFINLQKKILEWEWYKDQSVKVVFIHLLLIANFKDGRFKGRTIKRGQVVTSSRHLADDIGISRKTVRRCLSLLQETGEIDIETTNKYSLITIRKYDDYQFSGVASGVNEHPQSNPQGSPQSNPNRKRIKKNKKLSSKAERETPLNPSFEEVKDYANQRNANMSLAEDFYDFYESNGWMIGKNPMRNWKASFNGWMKRHKDDYNKKESEGMMIL